MISAGGQTSGAGAAVAAGADAVVGAAAGGGLAGADAAPVPLDVSATHTDAPAYSDAARAHGPIRDQVLLIELSLLSKP
jgi:hypothetical protein